MRKWKLLSAILAVICVLLVTAIFQQNQKIKEEILKEYILDHASLEMSLEGAFLSYEESGNARQLTRELSPAYAIASEIANFSHNLPTDHLLFTESIPYLDRLSMEFNFNMRSVIWETMDIARDGEITEKQLQNLREYYLLLKEFNEQALGEDFGENDIEGYIEDLEFLYTEYENRF